MIRRHMLFAFASSGAIILAGTATMAQAVTTTTHADAVPSAENGTEGDIIVTARRRDERLQSTPIAVTAFGAAQLENQSITNVADIGRLTPNLTLSTGRGLASQGFIFIRGVGQSDDNPAADPGVAQYVDDVYLGRTQGALFDLNDAASVEVLRGPQGTLYGKNALGGAIKVNSPMPGQNPEYKGSVSYGNYNAIRYNLTVSHPLIDDRLFARVSAQYVNDKGLMRNNLDGSRTNDRDVASGRLILRYLPTDGLELVLSGDVTRDNSKPYNGRIVATSNAGPLLAYAAVRADVRPYAIPAGGNAFKGAAFDVNTDPALGAPQNHVRAGGTSLRATWDTGAVTLKSITAYRTLNTRRASDTDASPINYVNSVDDLDQNQFSQELQAGGTGIAERLNWTVGLYYYREHFFTRARTNLLPRINPNGPNERRFTSTAKSYAAYGNASFKLTQALSATLGGRYTHESKDILTSTRRLGTSIITFGPAARSVEFNDFSPKLGLEYQVNPDIFLYTSASKGFKSGGFNGRAGFGTALDPYRPEEVWSYEAGIRSQWLQRRLTLNVTGFYSDYKDMQLQVFSLVNGNIAGLILNAAKARIQGIEVESSLNPLPGLSLFGNFAYTDAGYRGRFVDAVFGDLSNKRLMYTPKITAAMGFRYEMPVSADAKLAVGGDYSYRTMTHFDIQNDTRVSQPGYGLLNGKIDLNFDNGVSAGLFMKNIADKQYRQNGAALFTSIGIGLGYYGAPRTYGAELRFKF